MAVSFRVENLEQVRGTIEAARRTIAFNESREINRLAFTVRRGVQQALDERTTSRAGFRRSIWVSRSRSSGTSVSPAVVNLGRGGTRRIFSLLQFGGVRRGTRRGGVARGLIPVPTAKIRLGGRAQNPIRSQTFAVLSRRKDTYLRDLTDGRVGLFRKVRGGRDDLLYTLHQSTYYKPKTFDALRYAQETFARYRAHYFGGR